MVKSTLYPWISDLQPRILTARINTRLKLIMTRRIRNLLPNLTPDPTRRVRYKLDFL